MENGYPNKMVGGPGSAGIPRRKLFEVRFDGDEKIFRPELIPAPLPDEELRAGLRELVAEVLQADFGMEKPALVRCGACKAFERGRCRLKSDTQPERAATDGCFEGIHG